MKTRTLSRKIIYKGNYFTVLNDRIILPNGRQHQYEYISKGKYVGIVALVRGKIIIIKQYRHTIGKMIWEIPLGLVEKDESPQKAAIRELEEESGYRAGKIKNLISFYPSYGVSNEMAHLFFADKMKKTKTKHDDTEFLKVELWTAEKVFKEIGHKITDSASIIGLITARSRGLI